jgi:hypothetical protein
MERKCSVLIFLALMISAPFLTESLNAQEAMPAAEKKFIMLPFAFYTSDTGLALGLFSQYKFSAPDKILANAIYTFRNQFMLLAITDKGFDRIQFHNTLKVKIYNSEIYGIGNDTKNDARIKYEFSQVDNTVEAGLKIDDFNTAYLKVNNFYHRPGKNDILSTGYINSEDQFANGLGPSFRYKNVTDKFFRDGVEFRSSFVVYPSFLGNNRLFSVTESELMFYKSFNQSALNSLLAARFATVDAHPEKLSFIGGDRILRGYNEKRYMDRNMISLQLQYDIRIYKNLSGCVFASAGDVFGDVSDLAAEKIKFGWGAGFIYEFRGISLRFEAALPADEFDPKIIVIGVRAF